MEKEKRIDLKNRKKDSRELNGWVSFTAYALNENSLDELAAISEMLDRVGISLEVSRKDNATSGLEYDFVVLKVNKEQYQKVMTRYAGRKANFNKKYDKYGKCTVAELQEKLTTMTKTGIAAELGCSRMTLYRIMKNIAIQNPASDTSIWHYTS